MRTDFAKTMWLAAEGRATNKKKARAFYMTATVALLFGLLLLPAQPAQASTTFTVTNTEDPGNGICNARGGCTLREAIEAANATPGKDAIHFDIGGSGVKTIMPNSELPEVVEAVTIDGYTQSGASENTQAKGTNAVLRIPLNGANAGADASGLQIDDSGSVIKGLVINRFGEEGILINSSHATNNAVKGNFIGTNVSGTSALPNLLGIEINNAPDNTIGGSRPAARNLISGNDSDGVQFVNALARDNAVLGNLIGTDKEGTGDLGNAGSGVIDFPGCVVCDDNIVGGTLPDTANTIAFNDNDGVTVHAGDRNSILRNSIFSNGDLGIDLTDDGVTPNDLGDGDSGPNDLQNYPVLSSAENAGGDTTIEGVLNSKPNETFKVRFFSNPSGTDEGKKYIGAKSVTTNLNGNASFTFEPANEVPVGRTITATATRNTTDDTSEFSAPEEVV